MIESYLKQRNKINFWLSTSLGGMDDLGRIFEMIVHRHETTKRTGTEVSSSRSR